jgi:hypothetical protein
MKKNRFVFRENGKSGKKILLHCLSCNSRFQGVFTACSYIFKVINLVLANQGNYFENATACSKRMLKTRVAAHL